jgi:hypothetical protein
VTDSETTLPHGEVDFTLIVRPDKRHYQLVDVLIKFKYLHLDDVELDRGEKLTVEMAKLLTLEELKSLSAVQTALAQATTQLQSYRPLLQNAYSNQLRLRIYAVVAVGLERLVWEEVVSG